MPVLVEYTAPSCDGWASVVGARTGGRAGTWGNVSQQQEGMHAASRRQHTDTTLCDGERRLNLHPLKLAKHPQRRTARLANDGAVPLSRQRLHRWETRVAREGNERAR